MKQIPSTAAAVRLAFAAGLIAFVIGVQAQSPTPTPTPQASPTQAAAAVPPANPADVATMDAIVASLYDVISGPPGARNWDRFRSLFVPGARLIPTGARPTGEVGSRVLTPDEYAQRAAARFEKDGFFEREVSRRLEKFGNIAHIFSTYESRLKADDAKPLARGINSIQLMNDGKRWWIVTVFWQAEDEKNPLPAEYLRSRSDEETNLQSMSSTELKFRSRIEKANPSQYQSAKAWTNPELFLTPDGLYLTARTIQKKKIEDPDDLPCVLAALPTESWPMGRVILLGRSGIIPQFPPTESRNEQAYSYVKHVRSILTSLGIDISDLPVN